MAYSKEIIEGIALLTLLYQAIPFGLGYYFTSKSLKKGYTREEIEENLESLSSGVRMASTLGREAAYWSNRA